MATIDTTTGKPVEPRKPGIPAKDRPKIPSDMFAVTAPAEDTRASYRRQRDERDEQQKMVDQLVQGMYREWVDAGAPTVWADLPIKVWPLPAELEESGMFLLRKAARFLDRKLRFGNIRHFEKDGKKMVEIPFAVVSLDTQFGKKKSTSDE